MKKSYMYKVLLQLEGEYYIASRLAGLGYFTATTHGHTPGIDLVVTNAENSKSCFIQVKTSNESSFVLQKIKKSSKNLIYILYHKPTQVSYILDSRYLAAELESKHKKGVDEGRIKASTSLREFKGREKHKENWDLIIQLLGKVKNV